MGTKEDPFWQGSGRTIFAEAAYLMRNDPNRSYSKLVDTLLSIKIEKLRTFLRNSPAFQPGGRENRENYHIHPCCADQLRESHPLPAGD